MSKRCLTKSSYYSMFNDITSPCLPISPSVSKLAPELNLFIRSVSCLPIEAPAQVDGSSLNDNLQAQQQRSLPSTINCFGIFDLHYITYPYNILFLMLIFVCIIPFCINVQSTISDYS